MHKYGNLTLRCTSLVLYIAVCRMAQTKDDKIPANAVSSADNTINIDSIILGTCRMETCDFSTVAVCRSHMALTSIPRAFSWSP